MVAFLLSFLVALVGIGAIVAFGKRRPIGAPLSWGEAIAAATFAFALMFWAYGVVPHQWLQYANNELEWNSGYILVRSGHWELLGAPLPPFDLNFENLSHLIVVGIYGFFLGAHVAMFSLWQDRAKKTEARKQEALTPSTYGRPLLKAN